MREFPHLYGDTSALNTPFRSAAVKRVLDCDLRARFLHGSDFPVPIGTWYVRLRGLIDGDDRAAASKISNLIERDYFLKRAMSFDDQHFSKLGEVLRKI
jgi:hypothetical protein